MKTFIYCSFHDPKLIDHVKPFEIPFDTNNRELSHKNWCELVTQHAVLHRQVEQPKPSDFDFVGFSHYRRHFYESDLQNLKNDTIIVPRRLELHRSMFSQFVLAHTDKYVQQLLDMVDDPSFFIRERIIYPYNMFVMSYEKFQDYASWLFLNLNKLKFEPTGIPYQDRIYGFLGERLFTYWIMKSGYAIDEVDVEFEL